ncbi:MAG TPA: hypothetical protein VJM47_05845, partial [Nitrosospira sp.]|nr:hypothetical protein [Nitrosospira sp.]
LAWHYKQYAKGQRWLTEAFMSRLKPLRGAMRLGYGVIQRLSRRGISGSRNAPIDCRRGVQDRASWIPIQDRTGHLRDLP